MTQQSAGHSGKPEKRLRRVADLLLGYLALIGLCFGITYYFLYELSRAI